MTVLKGPMPNPPNQLPNLHVSSVCDASREDDHITPDQPSLWGAQSERRLPGNPVRVSLSPREPENDEPMPLPRVAKEHMDLCHHPGVSAFSDTDFSMQQMGVSESSVSHGFSNFQLLLHQVEQQHQHEIAEVRALLESQLEDLRQRCQYVRQGEDHGCASDIANRPCTSEDNDTRRVIIMPSETPITSICHERYEEDAGAESMATTSGDEASESVFGRTGTYTTHTPTLTKGKSSLMEHFSTNLKDRSWISVLVQYARDDTIHRSRSGLGKKAGYIISSAKFDGICATAIVVNALLLGISTDVAARNSNPNDVPYVFTYIDRFFSAWFLLELSLRMFADGVWRFFLGQQWSWNIFDFLVVTTDVAEALAVFFAGGSSGSMQNLTAIRMLRVLRIVRAIRVIRLVRFFRELRMMVYSVLRSVLSLLWSMILLTIVIFIFSVYLTQNVTSYIYYDKPANGNEYTDKLELYFGSLIYACYMLFQCISGGISWGEVGAPLLEIHWSNGLVLLFFVFFSVFSVLNIITGIFVDTALSSAQQDRDEVIQEAMHSERSTIFQMQKFFEEADADGSGSITLEELQTQLKDQKVKAHFKTLGIEANDAKSIFRLLDLDKSGEISIGEFIFGCLKMKGQAKSVDVMTLLHENRRMKEQMSTFFSYVRTKLREQQRFQEQVASAMLPRQTPIQRSMPSSTQL